jgi:hypothetical protein
MHKVMNETTSRMRGLISRRCSHRPASRRCQRSCSHASPSDLLLERRSSLSTENPGCRLWGVYAQAREFYGPKRRDRDAPVRIAQRQGCMRECTGGGAFAETVVCTLFGYLPKFGGTPELLNADTPRGFTGELRHVCCGAQRYTIQSRETGLMLEIES